MNLTHGRLDIYRRALKNMTIDQLIIERDAMLKKHTISKLTGNRQTSYGYGPLTLAAVAARTAIINERLGEIKDVELRKSPIRRTP